MKKYLVVVLFASLLLSCGCTKNKTQPITGFSPIETTQAGVSETKQEVTYTIPQTIKTYYKEIDFSKSSMALQEDLSQLTTKQHRHHLTYNELWDVLKVTDLTPAANEVYLLYGERGILQGKKAYTKGKNQNGGRQNQWNREHTYARSLGTPKLEQSSTGAMKTLIILDLLMYNGMHNEAIRNLHKDLELLAMYKVDGILEMNGKAMWLV